MGSRDLGPKGKKLKRAARLANKRAKVDKAEADLIAQEEEP